MPAGLLYTGPYFKAALNYALTIAKPASIRILSAKHGLLELDKTVEPYNLMMGQSGSVTAEQVKQQATDQNLLGEDVIAVTGKKYFEIIEQVWPNAERPLAGRDRLGYQLQWLVNETKKAKK